MSFKTKDSTRCAFCLNRPLGSLLRRHIFDGSDGYKRLLVELGSSAQLISKDFSHSNNENILWHEFVAPRPSLAFVPCREICEFLISRVGLGLAVDEILDNLRQDHERPTRPTKDLRWSSSKPPKGQKVYRVLSSASIPDDETPNSEGNAFQVAPFNEYLAHEDGSKYYWRLPQKYITWIEPITCEEAFFDLLLQIFRYHAGIDNDGENQSSKKRKRSETDEEEDEQGQHGKGKIKGKSRASGSRGGRASGSGSRGNRRSQADNKTQTSKTKEEYLAPKPKKDSVTEEYSKGEEMKWRWGPGWSSNSIIAETFDIAHPTPWKQPAGSETLVLEHPQPLLRRVRL
ncbi:hypothetical protein BDP27DRAFT_1405155 [Rhodocollybia butyracea]|uniref:Uncharacterized protein n=1 Tax=Rhodocollybia butyracea TaxID=206335 RepID=A0A9P5U3U1_9AGAR|nr:hypothetical protein BDP27DRAFT_1405155 [Rhodocollybia butyracea]